MKGTPIKRDVLSFVLLMYQGVAACGVISIAWMRSEGGCVGASCGGVTLYGAHPEHGWGAPPHTLCSPIVR